MIPTAFGPTGINPATRGFRLNGNAACMLVWCATARDRTALTGEDPNSNALRTQDKVYMRGLREQVRISNFQDAVAGQAANWQWRRICFTAKGLFQALGTSVDHQETSNGYVRYLADQIGTAFGATLLDTMFKGVQDRDWLTVFSAKTDNARISVKYDVTRQLNTGSGAKKIWEFKLWHPMNANLVYNADEVGKNDVSLDYSSLARQGMGDYYVVDFLTSPQNAASDVLDFAPQATLYWHER